MMMRKLVTPGLLMIALVLCASCSWTASATNFNGLSTPGGKPIAHVSQSNLAIHLLLSKPLLGDASLAKTVDDFTAAAKGMNASKVNIVQSKVTTWWFILPPFSFVLTPVSSNVAGDALQ
jgi:hypothetical protein